MTTTIQFVTTEAEPEPHFRIDDLLYFAKDCSPDGQIKPGTKYYTSDSFIRCVKNRSFELPGFYTKVIESLGENFLVPHRFNQVVRSKYAPQFKIAFSQFCKPNQEVSLKLYAEGVTQLLREKGIYDNNEKFVFDKTDKDVLCGKGPSTLEMLIAYEQGNPYNFLVVNGLFTFNNSNEAARFSRSSFGHNTTPFIKEIPNVATINASRKRTNRSPSLSGKASQGRFF